jgi:hypothetical protein
MAFILIFPEEISTMIRAERRVRPLLPALTTTPFREEWHVMAEHQDIAPVVYKELAEYPGYRFGSDGSVWSYRKARKGRKLVGPAHPMYGYRIFCLVNSRGKQYNKAGHVLTLIAFRGPRPPGMQACHNDGKRTNNRIENLRWDTAAGNQADKVAHGTVYRGERHPNSKLKDSDVAEIRRRLNVGHPRPVIAADFGVSVATIKLIHIGKGWRCKAAGWYWGDDAPMKGASAVLPGIFLTVPRRRSHLARENMLGMVVPLCHVSCPRTTRSHREESMSGDQGWIAAAEAGGTLMATPPTCYRRADGTEVRVWTCSVCGKAFEWGKASRWYGSYLEGNGGKWAAIIVTCNAACRRVGGRLVATDSHGPEGVAGHVGPMPKRKGGR